LLKASARLIEAAARPPFFFAAKMARMRGPSIRPLRGLLRTGFTMIELIVVIVLMAILAAFAMPRFFGRGDFEGPAFAQELASAARYAQKLAVVSGCPVELRVIATGYSLFQPVTPCGGAMTRAVLHPGSGSAFAATVPAGVSVAGGATVTFAASGVPDAPACYAVADQVVAITAGSGYVDVRTAC